MTTSDSPPRVPLTVDETRRAPRRSRWWALLLLIPMIAILPPLFGAKEPTLFGLPFYYWIQIAIVPLGIACIVLVLRVSVGRDEYR